MNLYKIKKGRHAARPLMLRIRCNPFGIYGNFRGHWQARLGDGWIYELPTNHNQWNKLCGDSFRLIDSSRQAVMLGVRHNEIYGLTEVSPYYNIGGNYVYYEAAGRPDDWPLVEVLPGQLIDFQYIVGPNNWVQTRIELPDIGRVEWHKIRHPAAGGSWFSREVNLWFGGTQPAPHDVTVWKKRIRGGYQFSIPKP